MSIFLSARHAADVTAVASSAQTGDYLYTGSEQTITLNPGLYDITAYGAQGGSGGVGVGGLGAEMEGQFSFATAVNLTILAGGSGGSGTSGGGGGGYGGAGGGGGSYIDSSATQIITEVSGIASPDDSPNGEIIITAVPEPTTLALAGLGALLLFFQRHPRGREISVV